MADNLLTETNANLGRDYSPTSGYGSWEPFEFSRQATSEGSSCLSSLIDADNDAQESQQEVIEVMVSEFERWLSEKENFINTEIELVDVLSESNLDELFTLHMRCQAEIQCYCTILSSLKRKIIQVSNCSNASDQLDNNIGELEIRWNQLFLKSLELQYIQEHRLSEKQHRWPIKKENICKEISIVDSLCNKQVGRTISKRSVESMPLITMRSTRKNRRRCMSLDNFGNFQHSSGYQSSQQEDNRLRYKTVRLSIPVPLSTVADYDASEEGSISSDESLSSRVQESSITNSKRNDQRQLQRRPSSTAESSDVETIQNLIESSHLQLKSLQERQSSGRLSSEVLATCQLNVRYLEDVKAGLARPENARLGDQLVQIDDLIKFWRNLEVCLSQSYPLAMDSTRDFQCSRTNRSEKECLDEKSARPNDSTQLVKLRQRRLEPVAADKENHLGRSDGAAKSHEAVIHEFQRVHCQWQDVSNELVNIERILTDCESSLRSFENDLSNPHMSETDKAIIHSGIQNQLANLKHIDDLHMKILPLSSQIVPALNCHNQHQLEERLNSIKNRKLLLRQWCSDLMLPAAQFSCGACALENAIAPCSSVQQRRLHYIRKFWPNTSATIEEPKEDFVDCLKEEDTSNKETQCDVKCTNRAFNWFIVLLAFVAIVYIVIMTRDCNMLYGGWLQEFLHPVYIPLC